MARMAVAVARGAMLCAGLAFAVGCSPSPSPSKPQQDDEQIKKAAEKQRKMHESERTNKQP